MVLPEGIHEASLAEVRNTFTFSSRRKFLFDGLVEGALALSEAGCKTLYLDGSYVTSKFNPGDYDVAWDPEEVNFKILDPVLAETRHPRASQKHKYRGEYLPTEDLKNQHPTYMVEYFQQIRYSQIKKGILLVYPLNDALLRSKSQ